MQTPYTVRRLFAVSHFVLSAALVGVPVANAQQSAGTPWRHKDTGVREASYAAAQQDQNRVEIRGNNSAAPVVAAAIGGLVIGAFIAAAASHHAVEASCSPATTEAIPVACAAPVQTAPACAYEFYDMTERRSFGSLLECQREAEDENRPAVVRVIDLRSGECVWTLCWVDGAWSVVGVANASAVSNEDAPEWQSLGQSNGYGSAQGRGSRRFARHAYRARESFGYRH